MFSRPRFASISPIEIPINDELEPIWNKRTNTYLIRIYEAISTPIMITEIKEDQSVLTKNIKILNEKNETIHMNR